MVPLLTYCMHALCNPDFPLVYMQPVAFLTIGRLRSKLKKMNFVFFWRQQQNVLLLVRLVESNPYTYL